MRNNSFRFLLLSLLGMGVSSLFSHAATYKEVGGRVVVEAEHFDSRAPAEDNDHHYAIAPDELTDAEASAPPGQYQSARGGKYMVLLPDSGENRNSSDLQAVGPHLDFKVQITTTGEYQLYIRSAGYDGASDSFYSSIIELQKARGGPGPDWYRYTFDPTPAISDFDQTLNNIDDPDSTAGWIGYSTPEINNGGAAGDREKTLWTISKAGTYTIRIQQREDGNGIDAVVLQRSNLPIPVPSIPESQLDNAADSDNDGIPDTAEIALGLNPKDASDAAKDNNGNGLSNLDEFKLGLDPNDTTKPALLAANATSTFDTLILTFSKNLDPATATNKANYAISSGLAVTAATYKSKVVTLTTAKQTADTAYTVTVKGIKDVSRFEVPAAGSTLTFYSYFMTRTGVLKFSYWGNITGTPVDGLLSDPRYPASPDSVQAVFAFNSRDAFPNDTHENYGATLEGFLTPTESAAYRFFVYSDDASQLFLSTDDKEANLAQIAEETGCCNNFTEPDSPRTSEPINLVAGKKYFIRLIYKEGGGGDFGQVAWRKTTDQTPAGSLTPISGKYLSAAVDLPAPAEGGFVTQTPTPNTKNASPVPQVTIVHRDGKVAWTDANVTLKYDGVAVKPTIKKEGNLATITYKGSGLLASDSAHTITLGYTDPGNKPATLEWSFNASSYKGQTADKLHQFVGLIKGKADLTKDGGGFSGKPGDRAIDLGLGGGQQSVLIPDASFLNAATAVADELTFSLWIKKYDIANSSAFWADSPSSRGTQRGFQAHTPWGDGNVYFDTAGCCDGSLERISAGISTFPDYTGDVSWWTNKWHHFAFSKKAANKQIWIDGKLFLEGQNTNPLPSDFAEIWLGAEGGGPTAGTANNMHGLLDDFSVFGTALSASDVGKLATGALPSSLAASTKILAYWDFNALAAAVAAKFTKIAKNADGSITLEWTGGGTLEAAASVTGPWQAVPGAASPFKLTPTGAQQFGRIKQ